MKELKNLLEEIKKRNITSKIAILGLVTIFIAVIGILLKNYFGYIVFIIAVFYFLNEKRKGIQEENKYKEELHQQELSECLRDAYYYIADRLAFVMRDYAQILGIMITTTNSITCTKKIWCKQDNGIWLYRYFIQSTKDTGVDFEEIRRLINERLGQEWIDYPIWVLSMQRKGTHLEVIATVVDCETVADQINNFERKRREFTKKEPSRKDDDF